MKTPEKYFQVDTKVDVGFVVRADDTDGAAREAQKKLKSLFDIGLGTYGTNYQTSRVVELTPQTRPTKPARKTDQMLRG